MIEKWREIQQGQIYHALIPESRHGSIQAGYRPVIIVSADWLNRTSSVFTVAELTTSLKNPTMSVHYVLPMMPVAFRPQVNSMARIYSTAASGVLVIGRFAFTTT